MDQARREGVQVWIQAQAFANPARREVAQVWIQAQAFANPARLI